MKSLIAGAIICACTVVSEEGVASPRCYHQPMSSQIVCEYSGHVRPYVQVTPPTPVYQQGVTIYSYPSRDRSDPKHDPSACTLATGCLPGSR